MSWNNNLGIWGGKNQNERSRKCCVCGGHNANNPKKNLNHNATKKRLQYRKDRLIKAIQVAPPFKRLPGSGISRAGNED